MNDDQNFSNQDPPRDPLADFIAERRSEFDKAPAPDYIWTALEVELEAAAFAKTAGPKVESSQPVVSLDKIAAPAPAPASRLAMTGRSAISDRIDESARIAHLGEAAQLEREASANPARGASAHPARAASARVLALYARKLAVACMLLVIGGLSGFLIAERFGESGSGSDLAIYSERTQRLEANYQREIDQRIAQLTALGADSALQAEMVSLSQPDYVLQEDLVQLGASNEQLVIAAMAQEYKAKLEALEHVLTRLRAADRTQPRPSLTPARTSPDSPRLQNL